MAEPDKISSARRMAQILAVGTLLLFVKSVFFDFINLDDPQYIENNPHVISGLTLEGIRWAFALDNTQGGFWIPMTHLSLMLDVTLFGHHAAGFHLVNVLFHMANTLLLFHLFRRLTNRFWESAWVATLFAVHPQHVEAVAWVVERKEVLAAFFGLLALWQYILYVETRRATPLPPSGSWWHNPHYLLIFPLLMCSLWSKPMWVTLPGVFLLLDWWPLDRQKQATWSHLIREKIPLLLPVLLAAGMALLRTDDPDLKHSWAVLPLSARIGNFLISLATYLRQTVWPSDLSIFYLHPYLEKTPPATLELAAGTGVMVVLTALAFMTRRTRPYLLVGWLWFLGGLVPVSGLAQSGNQGMADRFVYYPHMGLLMAMVWGGAAMLPQQRFWRRSLLALGVVATFALTVVTWRQLDTWLNSGTVWSHAVRMNQNNHYAHALLHGFYSKQKNVPPSHTHIDAALRLRPDHTDYILLKAVVFLEEGREDKFIEWVHKAEQIKPNSPNIIVMREVISTIGGDMKRAYDRLHLQDIAVPHQ
ncbi:MAG: hypothetical protein H7833_01870 [Magnetococcus sp. DMHC-1]|nr:hypothetical protein [Magnetococcales bacterium]